MSERWPLILVVILLALVVVAPQVLREYPLGMDPFYYMAYGSEPQPGMPPLFFFLTTIPSLLLSFVVTASVLYLFYLIWVEAGGQPIPSSPLNPLWLLIAAPAFFLRMAIFEDDLIGIPLCLFAVLIFLIGEKKSRLYKVAALGLTAVGYFVVWRGCILFLALFMFYELVKRFKWGWLTLPFVTIYPGLQPSTFVGEAQAGFLFLPVFMMGLLLGVLGWFKTHKFIQVWAFFFLGLGLLQARWLWLATFPLAIMLWEFLKDHKKKEAFLIVAVGLGLFMGSMTIIQSQPLSQQMSDLKEVISITGNNEINNCWWTGHWLYWLGGNPRYTNLRPQPISYNPGPAPYHLTNESLNLTLVRDFQWIRLYRQEP